MKSNVLIFGSIIGIILVLQTIYMVHLIYSNPGFESSHILGYIFMIAVFSLAFFGIRNYRNKNLNGFISFGKAFKTGALIAFIGATYYTVFWLSLIHI